MKFNRLGALTAPVLIAGLALVPAAGAEVSHAGIQIREVYPGTVASPDAEYVELQMWAPGQNDVAAGSVRTYDTGGAVTSVSTFQFNVNQGKSQSTVLVATPAAESQFGVVRDLGLTAGFLDPSGGAVCWGAFDCVSWGNFSGRLPDSAGTPAAAIPDGLALRRDISADCVTSLDRDDDRNDSALDFAAGTPAPRSNLILPIETLCPGEPPTTKIDRKAAKRGTDPTPTFSFHSPHRISNQGLPVTTHYQCRVDDGRFKACRSPFTSKRLTPGRHRFSVRATDTFGGLNPEPETYSFTVLRRRR